MAGLIDLDLCIRIEQAIPKRRAIINAIWSPDPTTGKMTYDISADDNAHKHEKWAVVGNPGAASLSEAELTAPRLWVRMTQHYDERATVPRARTPARGETRARGGRNAPPARWKDDRTPKSNPSRSSPHASKGLGWPIAIPANTTGAPQL